MLLLHFFQELCENSHIDIKCEGLCKLIITVYDGKGRKHFVTFVTKNGQEVVCAVANFVTGENFYTSVHDVLEAAKVWAGVQTNV